MKNKKSKSNRTKKFNDALRRTEISEEPFMTKDKIEENLKKQIRNNTRNDQK